jgi:hypothetical protein
MAEVIAFKPHRVAPLEIDPELVELRLTNDCGIEMTLFDRQYAVAAVLNYRLASRPCDFDLNLLRTVWNKLRGNSGLAS